MLTIMAEKQEPTPRPQKTIRKAARRTAKRQRVSGGQPAVAKRVVSDLDTEDELIARLKEARYRDADIAQRLIDQGMTVYNPKSIGNRYLRIRFKLQERQDRALDENASDWHEGDV